MRYLPEQHLRRQVEIKAVREQGRRMDCGAFTLWWLRRDPSLCSLPRVCVVASYKGVGNAVCRARAKRRLRELFRLNQKQLPQDCDYMLIARQGCLRQEMTELERRFLQAAERVSGQRSRMASEVSKPGE